MADRDVVVLTDVMLVTCVVQKGMADGIVRACRDAGAEGATVYYARGSGVRERLGVLGVAVEVEKEVMAAFPGSEVLIHQDPAGSEKITKFQRA